MDARQLANRIKQLAARKAPGGFINMKDNLASIVSECDSVLSGFTAPEEFDAEDDPNTEPCMWCGAHTSDTVRDSNDEESHFCSGCKSDLPQWMRDNLDDVLNAIGNDCMPDDIRAMAGSLKRFATGIFSVKKNEDGEVLIAKYENIEDFKRDVAYPEDWKVEYAFKDGKRLNFSVQVTEE